MIEKEEVGFCRGMRVRDGKWVFGGYSYHSGEGRGFITNVGIDNKGPICWMQEVYPQTVGRFTGLYDATTWEELSSEEQSHIKKEEWEGRPIFQGDIIEAHYDERHPEDATRSVVLWSEIGYQDHGIGWYMKQGRYLPDPLELADAERNRVIGNIHENADILEGHSYG